MKPKKDKNNVYQPGKKINDGLQPSSVKKGSPPSGGSNVKKQKND